MQVRTIELKAGRRLHNLIDAFDTVMLAYIGVVSGVFDELSERGSLSPRSISVALDLDERLVEAYCKAATAYGLVNQIDDDFHLSEFSTNARIPTNHSVVFRGHRAYILSLFPKILKGHRIEVNPFITGLESKGCSCLATSSAVSTLKELLPVCRGRCDILDLGAGHGTSLLDLLKLHPESTGVAVEVDHGLVERIENEVASRGMANRAQVVRSDVRRYEPNKKFKVVLLNSILHYLGREERWSLVERVFAWLEEGGYIAILEQPMPENCEDLARFKRRAILNLEFLGLHGLGLLTVSEITAYLHRCGFRDAQIETVDPAGTSTYIVARKPETRRCVGNASQ